MLTLEFIAGYISAQGSFTEYVRNGRIYHAFQIKSSTNNSTLLDQIAATLELYNHVYKYQNRTQGYSLLLVRDRESILNKIIPALDGRLIGIKEQVFIDWKNAIMKQCSMWNFRNIKTTRNPTGYQKVDKNPNTLITHRG